MFKFNNNEIKHLVFDAANTIIYKPTLWSSIINVFNKHNINCTEEKLKLHHKIISEIINFPDTTSSEFYHDFNSQLLKSLGIIPSEGLLTDVFKSCSYLPWQIFDDVKYIQEINLPKSIISNFNTSLASKLAPLTFDNIFSSEIIGLRKPSLEFYKYCIDKINIDPANILYIGDSLHLDIMPANKLGMNALLIDRDNVYLKQSNIIHSFKDILQYYE